ncbi:hypothetical protein HY251_12750 [bacterium]|nr:hypothetical protein [bacterium]
MDRWREPAFRPGEGVVSGREGVVSRMEADLSRREDLVRRGEDAFRWSDHLSHRVGSFSSGLVERDRPIRTS